MNVEKAIKNFKLRGYTVKHFATGAEAGPSPAAAQTRSRPSASAGA